MQALSRTSIGWGWSVMVYLNAVTTVLRTWAAGLVRFSYRGGEEGGMAESSACTYVCVLYVHMCVTV